MYAEGQAIYLDYAATAPLRPEVWTAMAEALDCCFNPVSSHSFGQRAHYSLEEARAELAGLIGCRVREVYFTGGGTSSSNLAVLGFVRANAGRRPRVLISEVEHQAGLGAARHAAEEGADVRLIPVDASATLRLDVLETVLAQDGDRPTLVSVMWANNEVGTVQPIAQVERLTHRHGALLHTDAVQAFGKLDVSVERIPADLLSATAHKLGGLVGIGLLYCREGVDLAPLTYGGTQERALWPGTQNPLAAVGFARAARLAVEDRTTVVPRWQELRERLTKRLNEGVHGLTVHAGDAPERLPNILSVGIPDCDPGALLVSLDLDGIAVSAGSACSSGSVAASHVLEAMGIAGSDEYATLRYSFGPTTTREHVERAADATIRACSRIMAHG